MSQDYAAMIAEVSDDEFPMMLRQQLNFSDMEDLPEALRIALQDRARKLGINLEPPTPDWPKP